MKKTNALSLAALALCMMSCGGSGKNQTDNEDSKYELKDSNSKVSENSIYVDSAIVTIKDKEYQYFVDFHSVDSLPHFISLQGEDYPDNAATLIIRNDSNVILSKSFTKSSFKSYIPEKLWKDCGLVSFCYNALRRERNEDDAFYFIASIGSLDDPDEIPYTLEVQIFPDGGMNISKMSDTDSDTGPLSEGLNVDPKE